MSFTSYKYGIFVVVAFCAYYLVARLSRNPRPQNVLLLVLGYSFYALWDWRWCLLLAGVTLSGYVGGVLLERSRSHRRLVLVCVILVNLAALGLFKYFSFFADSFTTLLGRAGVRVDWVTLHLVLPVGISYYVFQNLSYVIDVFRGDYGPRAGALEYATALSLFPALLSGPITRPRDLVPQLSECRGFDSDRAGDGMRQILWGLVKKMLVADTIGVQVDYVWANTGSYGGLALAATALLYSLQIYCDFSGYADIAIGTGKLLNLRLSKNFDYPYFSTSIRMFWRRWHITLSNWMRDYLYISMGGNRVTLFRRNANVLITFLAVGLWHGANWTYVVWGLMHGVYITVENNLRSCFIRQDDRQRKRWRSVASAGLVFALVTIAWVFFRAPSLGAAVDFIVQGFTAPFVLGDHWRYVPVLLLAIGLLVYEWFTRRWEHGLAVQHAPLAVRWVLYATLGMAVLLFGQLGGQEGIYVQF